MLIGYVRVSTNDQNTALQRNALESAGCELIFEDKISGKVSDRPGLKKVLRTLSEGDTLVVWKLDRLGRSMRHLVGLVEELREKGVNFRSLTDSIDTSGLAPIFPYTFYHLTHYWFAAADIPVANDTPVHYADAIRCNVRRPPQGSLPLLTRRVSA